MNLFDLHDTHGFSLSDSLPECLKRDIKPDWLTFYKSARKAGWTPEKIQTTVKNALVDSGYPDTIDSINREVFTLALSEMQDELNKIGEEE